MISLFIPTVWSDDVEHRRKISEGLTQVVDFINSLRFGSTVITLDANGDGVVDINPPYDNSILSVIAINGDIGSTQANCFANLTSSLNSFDVHFRANPGAISVRVNWLVIGQ